MSDVTNAEKTPENSAPFSLQNALVATSGKTTPGEMPSHIEYSNSHARGVSSDSRHIWPNSVFVALRGARFDGHDFLIQAQQNGAAFAVIEDATNAPHGLTCVRVLDTQKALGDLARFHRARFAIPVVGVTGSYGKTTTRAFIAAALAPLGEILASRENFNNEIGVPKTLLQLDESHKSAVIEMGMRGAGQIAYLADVARPTIGVITNIGPQHIELLGSLENIARAKAEILENLPQNGVAILPADGEFAAFLREKSPCRVVTFGVNSDADFRVSSTRSLESGHVEVQIVARKSSLIKFVLPLPGAHNALNAAAALAVADALKIDLNDAARALEKAGVPGARLRVVRTKTLTILDDCYNAGPDSMRAALETMRDFPNANANAKRRVAVLGAMKELGEFAEDEHRKLGELAAQICDAVCFVGEETRAAFEVADAVANIEKTWCENASAAADRVLDFVRNGDIVLVKGSRSIGLETVVEKLVND